MKKEVFIYNLKKEIKKQGLKGYQVAEFLNISNPTYITKCNNYTFTLLELEQLQTFLNISLLDLFEVKKGINYNTKSRKQNTDKKKVKKEVIKKDNQHGSNYDYLNSLL